MKHWLLLFLSLFCFALSTHAATPLPGTQVFQLSAKVRDPNTVELRWKILPGYFLYKERFTFKLDSDKALIGIIPNFTPSFKDPNVENKTDKILGNYSIYRHQADFVIPILANESGEIKLQVNYQGCADSGFCYPPTHSAFLISVDHNKAITEINPIAETTIPPDTAGLKSIKHLLNGQSTFWIIVTFFGLGLLLAFTPCILPMVPILSGIIVGHGKTITTRKAFLLSITYVLSMALTYTLIGILFALIGGNLQASFQKSWVIALYAALFVLLSLSMFGFYELKIPASLQARFAALSHRETGSGTYVGVAIMGCLSTLILSPCVTAPLVGVLSYIAQSGDVTLGAIALFSMSLGMGTPLLLIGASAGKLLPKTGLWMNTVKALFGVLLLVVAIILIDRIVAPQITLILWAALLIVIALYMGALQPHTETHFGRLWQGFGILFLVYGILLIVGASLGNTQFFRPLAGLTITTKKDIGHASISESHSIKTKQELETAIQKTKGKPILLDFYADWCISCKKMETQVFTDPEVQKLLQQFLILRVDLTDQNAETTLLSRDLNVIAPPTFLFFDRKGKLQETYNLVGELNAEEFAKHLQFFLKNSS
jgi:thiol:disulfide interchange protein DsbD